MAIESSTPDSPRVDKVRPEAAADEIRREVERLGGRRALLAGLAGLGAGAVFARTARAGDLNPPPGPIAPTMRTLDEIEPRTPIGPDTTPGDATSVYRITEPGSYYLTENLQGEAGKHGIKIEASGVTVDLMGFELLGSGIANDGIREGGPGLQRIMVRNGAIRGFEGYSIRLTNSSNASVVECNVREGDSGAISLGTHAVVAQCTVVENTIAPAAAAIEVGDASLVTECIVADSLGSSAIRTGQCSQVSHCVCNNTPSGIRVGPRSVLHACAVHYCNSNGSVTGDLCTISNCVFAASNGTELQVGDDCIITACTVWQSTGHGIFAGDGCTLRDCAILGPADSAEPGIGAGNACAMSSCIVRQSHVIVGADSRLVNCRVVGSLHGIALTAGDGAFLDGCVVSDSIDYAGITLGSQAVVRNCVARLNSGSGFITATGSIVENCFAGENAEAGISVGSGSVVRGCSARDNGGSGIVTSSASVVTDCSARGNGGAGISTQGGCSVSGNAAQFNAVDGIAVTNDCTVRNNTCFSNSASGSSAGIRAAGENNRIEANNLTNNNWGIRVESAGNLVVGNSCSGNSLTNFEIVAGNRYGPIVNAIAGGTAAVSGNSAASTVLSTDPWANFAY